MKITKNFSLEEFERSETAMRLHIDNRIPEELIPRIRVLCERVLEPVRREFGAVRITSGYRCPALNRAVGGVANSQHCRGEAADFVVCDEVKSLALGKRQSRAEKRKVKSVSLREVFSWMMENLAFDQLIWERSWIHVSFREGRNRQEVIYL